MRASFSDFGPYRIVRSIATGGMAEIFLARQRAIEGVERTVVLKQILPTYADDAEFITMFLDEARLLAALSHPNIAQVFDVGRAFDTYYLAMEYVRGPTLGRLLSATRDRGGLPRREALGIGLAIAEALHYVHERRDEVGRPLDIVHRDLNPANVIVSYDGAVKLIDFGIAKAATKVYETRAGVIKGTYGYIAPEQLVGTTPVDRRADVFALGLLLYEMVVGEHPFDVSDEPDQIDRILEARYRRPRDVRGDVPRDLDRLIARCLAPHPQGRPEDMGVVIAELAAHLGQQGMVPTQTSLAAVARDAVPDAEGPRPMARLTSAQRPRPFGADPTGTRELRPIEPSLDTEPRRAEPRARGDELWNEETVTFGDRDEPLTLAAGLPGIDRESVAQLRAQLASGEGRAIEPVHARIYEAGDDDHTVARAPHASGEGGAMAAPAPLYVAMPGDDDRTTARAHPRVGDADGEEEAPTRLLSISDPVGVPRIPAIDQTFIPPRRAAPRKGLPPAVLIGGAVVAMIMISGLTFGLVRLLGPSDTALPPETPARVQESTPSAIELSIVSEPPGATVHVDGAPAPGETPLRVTLPHTSRQVWVRVSMDGYYDQEREVIATVGEARFVLRALD